MKDVSLKAQTRDNKRGRSAVEKVFIIGCLFLQSPALNSEIFGSSKLQKHTTCYVNSKTSKKEKKKKKKGGVREIKLVLARFSKQPRNTRKWRRSCLTTDT